MGGLNKRRISTEFLTFEWYPHNYLTLFTRISTITKFHILYFLLHTSVIILQSTHQPRTEYAPPPQVSGFTVVTKKEPDQPKVPETSLSPTAFLTTDASLYEQQLHQQHQQERDEKHKFCRDLSVLLFICS